jgi:hypothetical protein
LVRGWPRSRCGGGIHSVSAWVFLRVVQPWGLSMSDPTPEFIHAVAEETGVPAWLLAGGDSTDAV